MEGFCCHGLMMGIFDVHQSSMEMLDGMEIEALLDWLVRRNVMPGSAAPSKHDRNLYSVPYSVHKLPIRDKLASNEQ